MMTRVLALTLLALLSITSSSSSSVTAFRRVPFTRTEAKRPVGFVASDIRRRQPTVSSPPPVLPLRGNVLKLGIFYTTIAVSGVIMNVSVDTGSSDLIVPAAGCQGCKPGTPTYNPSTSPTSTPVPCINSVANCTGGCQEGDHCAFYNSYVTCDLKNLTKPCIVSGPIYKDMVTFGGVSLSTYFGAITNQSADFQQMQLVDGIIGMAYWAAQAQKPEAFAVPPFQNFYEHGEFAENRFGMCLRNETGALVLGGDDPSLFIGDFMYTPIIEERWYSVYVDSLSIGDAVLAIAPASMNDGICIVDSGTNFLLLNQEPYAVLKQYFLSLCGSGGPFLAGICDIPPGQPTILDGICTPLQPIHITQYPNISVTLKGNVKLTMTPWEYLVHANDTAGNVCFGIGGGGASGSCIIGDVVMQPYYTAFDRTKSVIGFAPVNADACHSEGVRGGHIDEDNKTSNVVRRNGVRGQTSRIVSK